MRLKIKIILLFILLTSGNNAHSQITEGMLGLGFDSVISIRILHRDNSYCTGEPIMAEFGIKNISKDTLKLIYQKSEGVPCQMWIIFPDTINKVKCYGPSRYLYGLMSINTEFKFDSSVFKDPKGYYNKHYKPFERIIPPGECLVDSVDLSNIGAHCNNQYYPKGWKAGRYLVQLKYNSCTSETFEIIVE